MNRNLKFRIGDKVMVRKTNDVGTVKKIRRNTDGTKSEYLIGTIDKWIPEDMLESISSPVFAYEYARPMVTTDMAVIRKKETVPEILLIRRDNQPYKGCWALPGGYLEMEETIVACALRELKEETSITRSSLKTEPVMCGYLDDPDRDPRGRTISFLFATEALPEAEAHAADDATETRWFPINELPHMAFDHMKAVLMASYMMKISLN